MTRRFKYALMVAAMLLNLVSCRKEDAGQENAGQGATGDETYIVLGLSAPKVEIEATKAQSEWLQKVTLGNVHVAIFDQETGTKLFYKADYPGSVANKCLIGSNEYYQVAWNLTGTSFESTIVANPGKKYKIIVSVNHRDSNTPAVYEAATKWAQIMEMNPDLKLGGKQVFSTINMSRDGVSPNMILYRDEEDDFSSSANENVDLPYINLWCSPVMSGTIENLTLGKGVNLIGFTPQGGSFEPAIDLNKLNSDLGTSYTAVPWCRDATEVATSHELGLTPCYAQLIVNSITNATSGKFTLTDIFVMNVPNRFTSFAENQTCYFNNEDYTKSPKLENSPTLTFSRSKSLVSGFLPDWATTNMSSDNFVRLLHYPVESTVTYADFTDNYKDGGYFANSSSYVNYRCQLYLALLDIDTNASISIPTDKNNGVVKRMEDKLTQWNNTAQTFWKNNPVFLITQNDGDYPNEDTLNLLGERQYRYATRLVLRGKWKESYESEEEIVYYPILINHKDHVYDTNYDSETAESEKETFVKRGRRYIYDITIKNKGVPNPWTDADIDVSLGSISLKVTPWVYANVELPKYIY